MPAPLFPFTRTAVLATLLLPGAAALADGTFTPVSEIPGIVEPPPTILPLNAPQVILGLADRYIAIESAGLAPFDWTTYTTTDFITRQNLPNPAGAYVTTPLFAAQSGWPILGRTEYRSPPNVVTARACIWNQDGTVTVVPNNAHAIQVPCGMSDDGEHWLLHTGFSQYNRTFYYDNNTPTNIVPDPNEDAQLDTQVYALSPDGLTVAGSYNESHWDFFTWTAGGPGAGAPTFHTNPFGMSNFPALVSNGGTRVVLRPSSDPYAEFIPNSTWSRGVWRSTPGFAALTMTRDGHTLLGSVRTGAADSNTYSARLWTETLGVRPLAAELTSRGIYLRGWTLTHADYIADDNRTIVGRGLAPGRSGTHWWVAVLPAPIAAADIASAGAQEGGDGKLDNNDFIVFINRFFAHDERADVAGPGAERTPDGAFDNNDFIQFITLFFSGEP